MKAAITWIMCRVRRYRPDDNALRRPSDRLEAAALAVTAILLVLSVWPAVLVAEHVSEQERKDAAERHHVLATLLEDALAIPLSLGRGASPGKRVAVRWVTPEGEQRTGTVALQKAAGKGSTVRVWIDGAGELTTPPPTPGTIGFTSISTAVLVVMGAAWVLYGGFLGFRRALDRRRYAGWDRAWAQANARWRRPHQS
ncbi:Rv1733c family protein [Nonomuraea sp. bgisy101]|uniref:Rv1733c family protein n=1 Tax=Nonomuraea sp. bgisy101 TaxID=3413784 RepID=UPI003D740394